MVKKILLGITAVLISSGAIAGELWQKLNTGSAMSVVLQEYSNAKVDSEYKANSNFDSRATISSYKLFDKDFTVHFLFKDEGLSTVNLLFKGDKKEADALFKQVALGLKSKYGEPLEVKSPGMGLNTIDWADTDKKISMITIGRGDLAISYSSKFNNETSKL